MKYCHGLLFAIALAVAAPIAASESTAPAMEAVTTMRLDGWLVIDTQGNVADYAITTPADKELLASLDRNIHQWRFAPVVIDGAPVLAKADFKLTLAARRVGERAEVRVDNLLFPDPAQEARDDADRKHPRARENATTRIVVLNMAPPKYPVNLQRAGVSGRVLVALRLNTDGSVAQAEAVQTVLLDVRGRDRVMQEVAHELEATTLATVRRWRFDVTVKGATPSASDLTALVPVSYSMSRKPTPAGTWRAEVRGVHHDISWLPPRHGQTLAGASDVESGEPMPVASNVELKDGTIGQLLL